MVLNDGQHWSSHDAVKEPSGYISFLIHEASKNNASYTNNAEQWDLILEDEQGEAYSQYNTDVT